MSAARMAGSGQKRRGFFWLWLGVISLAVLVLVVGMVIVGVVWLRPSSGGRSISANAGAEALSAAGFLHTRTARISATIAAQGGIDGAIYTVDVRPGGDPWPPIRLLDFRSAQTAKRDYRAHFSAARFRKLPELLKHSGNKLPHGYAPSKILSYRICNVVLWSYNADRNPQLTARVRRVARLLRNDCR